MIPSDPMRNLGPATILRADARTLPLADNSVDLVCTSPPYFSLRSYQDGGEHYAGQLGSEATPAEFIDALIDCTREMVRVVKPSGSIWVNLGDKYGEGQRRLSPHGQPKRPIAHHAGSAAQAGRAENPTDDRLVRPKSLLGIPWRYALRCIDDLGLILRAEVVWSKPNGLPESVTDRVRRSHEQWFHFTLEPRYYSAVDEIREATTNYRASSPLTLANRGRVMVPGNTPRSTDGLAQTSMSANPLGKLPGSVWTIPTEPLRVPDHLGIDHFAAFPSEWPKRIIRGWSPAGVCTACGEGRRPIISSVGLDMTRPQARRAQELADRAGLTEAHFRALLSVGVSDTGRGAATQTGTGKNTAEVYELAEIARTALGGYAREYLLRRPTGFDYACACPQPTAPTTPSLILDPFGGTGTVAMVARALGRHGVHADLSADYNRLAHWRITNLDQLAAVQGHQRTKRQPDDQPTLLDEIPEVSA